MSFLNFVFRNIERFEDITPNSSPEVLIFLIEDARSRSLPERHFFPIYILLLLHSVNKIKFDFS